MCTPKILLVKWTQKLILHIYYSGIELTTIHISGIIAFKHRLNINRLTIFRRIVVIIF